MQGTTGAWLAAAALAAVAAATGPAYSQSNERRLAMTDDGWTLSGDVKVERQLGHDALGFGTGAAYHPGQRFRDGTIAFDVAASPRRTFVGVRFRAQSPDVWEEIYIRPHKLGLPDALQYAPAFAGGRSAWQLYHGPGETATATMPLGAWVRVRLVVRGSQAALFLGDDPTPALIVPRLAHPPAEGFIGFAALDASAERGTDRPSAISNIVVQPGVADFAFPEAEPPSIAPGVITAWEVSGAFAPSSTGPPADLPSDVLEGPWRHASAEPSGLVPLDRVVDLPAQPGRLAALARVTIRAERPVTVPFTVGYSDDASVFLNRDLLFSGVNGYSFNFPRRDGLITIDQATVYLPLRAGENELLLAVSDVFGGWGLMGRLEPRAGVILAGPPPDGGAARR
ncbi:MAG TPA: hypothetical protein VMQ83_10395 [Gammaproteobacteria bacterium]|nr:hypothetical protein [Gammaproteobacteria bacterium]